MAGPAVSAGPRQVSQYRSHYIEAEHPRTTPCWPREGFAQTGRTRARTSADDVSIRWAAREGAVYEHANDDETPSSRSTAAAPAAAGAARGAAAAADEEYGIILTYDNTGSTRQRKPRQGRKGGSILAPPIIFAAGVASDAGTDTHRIVRVRRRQPQTTNDIR